MLRRLRIENLVLIREAELVFAPGLNAITGETGAGKTILAQAIGLLLGAKGDATYVGPGADEAYVEAELDLPEGVLDEEDLASLAELRPADEDGLVLARRVFADGRTRAYAWGRSAPREDVAAIAERLIAMSGQFEQRRLARPSYQLDVLDSFLGDEQLRRRAEARRAWRELQIARRRHDELTRGAAEAEARLAELRALVEDTEGMEPDAEAELRAERDRLRHVDELAHAATSAAEALTPEDGEGAAELLARAEAALRPAAEIALELADAAEELRRAQTSLREVASSVRAFLGSLESDPGRLEHVEAELDRIATARRRFGADTYDELLERAAVARAELAALGDGADPVATAAAAVAAAEERVRRVADELRAARAAAAGRFAEAVATELRDIGMGGGEFRIELSERPAGAAGADGVAFLIRPNRGMPFAPVAETASGGELSRVALAIAAVSGGGDVFTPATGADADPAEPGATQLRRQRAQSTLIFDEIDAGIGGRTANAVGEALRRLAERAQVVTITHLPQIATLAEGHFRVEKVEGDPTHTQIERLDDDARRDEIERMLGGEEFLAKVR